MLSKILTLDGVQQLNKNQQNLIKGGQTYECYCGHVDDPYTDLKYYVEADSVSEALNGPENCGGLGKTCTGLN